MAPLKSLLMEQFNNTHLDSKTDRKIYFYYGARTEEDLLYKNEFFKLSKQYPNFYYYPVLSKPSEGWTGETGYVQELLKSNIHNFSNIEAIDFYVCGPAKMMSQTLELLKSKNVDASNIAFDQFT